MLNEKFSKVGSFLIPSLVKIVTHLEGLIKKMLTFISLQNYFLRVQTIFADICAEPIVEELFYIVPFLACIVKIMN